MDAQNSNLSLRRGQDRIQISKPETLVRQNISVFQAVEGQTFRGSKLNNWWCTWMRTFILFVKAPQIFFKLTEASDHISPFPYPEWTCELLGRCLGSGHFNSFGCILTFSLEEFLLIFFMLFIKLLFCSFRPFLCVEWENHFIWWNLHFRNGEQRVLSLRTYYAKIQSPNILELCVFLGGRWDTHGPRLQFCVKWLCSIHWIRRYKSLMLCIWICYGQL